MLNSLLEIVGFLLVVTFCVIVWPPSALLVGGVGLLAASAVRDRRTGK